MVVAHELGLPHSAALKNIFVVNQAPAIDTNTGMALIFRSNLLAEMKETELKDDKGNFFGWRIWMKRTNGVEVIREFTLADAAQAKLTSKDNWKAYPSTMCNYRAKAFVARALFPDVLMGLNFVEEFDRGPVIEGQWSDAVSAETPSIIDPQAAPATLESSVNFYGVDAIMTANGGRIPGTEDEVKAVAEKLAAK